MAGRGHATGDESYAKTLAPPTTTTTTMTTTTATTTTPITCIELGA
jgi:hypothetical protein